MLVGPKKLCFVAREASHEIRQCYGLSTGFVFHCSFRSAQALHKRSFFPRSI